MATRGSTTLALGIALGAVAGGVWLLRRAAQAPEPLHPTELFQQVLGHIRRYGVDSLGEPELYRLAARGLVQELDDEFAAIHPVGEERVAGPDAGGLGLLLSARGGRVAVLGVLPDSPADSAGVAPGDQLIEVGQRPVEGLSLEGASRQLEGARGTTVRLLTRRPGIGQLLEYELRRGAARGAVVHEPVDLGGGVWYLRVGLLGAGAVAEVGHRLEPVRRSAGARLILDLRGASGGVLGEGVALAGLFLDRGDTVVTVLGRDSVAYRASRSGADPLAGTALAVLVDGGTADAAEVTAAALQDHDRALVIGHPTFGRGTSPEEFTLDGRFVIRISTSRWRAPGGRSLQPDSFPPPDSLAARPLFRTAAGRAVRGGGGIVPDSVVAPLTGSESDLAFLRTVGARLPKLQAAARAAGATAAAGATDAQLLEAVRRAALQRGVGIGPEALQAGRGWVLAEVRAWAARARGGWAGEARRLASGPDPALELAVRLLRAARGPGELLGVSAVATAR